MRQWRVFLRCGSISGLLEALLLSNRTKHVKSELGFYEAAYGERGTCRSRGKWANAPVGSGEEIVGLYQGKESSGPREQAQYQGRRGIKEGLWRQGCGQYV